MKKIAIVGAGGLGREVAWLLERINLIEEQWDILGYYDDFLKDTKEVINYPMLGTVNDLLSTQSEISIVCAIANPIIRKKIIEKLGKNNCISFPTIIDPSVIISPDVNFGIGNVIMMNSLISVKTSIEDFCIITYSCTLGHDVKLSDFVTVYPGTNIAGNVIIQKQCEIGTGSQIIQGKKIGSNSIVGAGSVVVKDLLGDSTYVGMPAKSIK